MTDPDLRQRVAARFAEVNGEHPMTAADDAYVTSEFVVLDELCRTCGRDVDEVRSDMLADRLPLPGYLRSDGAQMVPADLFALADSAGGAEHLHGWFVAHWTDPAVGEAEWRNYLSGQYVCLRSVTPSTIQRKDQLVAQIREVSAHLHAMVDELDALEPEFTGYDRLRFGGPTSRDTWITGMRTSAP